MDQNDAPKISPVAMMRLSARLAGLVREKEAINPTAPMAGMKTARVVATIATTMREMGMDMDAGQRVVKAFELEGGPEPVPAGRTPTAKFFDFDPNRKHGDRKKDNAAAMALLDSIDAGDVDPDKLTDAQKEVLARYSGTGGNLVGADGKKGSAYEYYTPKPIAAGMWVLFAEMGFKGGKVGDPCSGVGIFGATAPANAAMDTVELNETSGRINRLVNGGPGYSATVAPFEAVASRTPDEIWDAVISNVPFGGVHDRGANRKIDPKYQNEPLETYFILRSLEKLKPGGLAAFIVPPRIVSAKGGREESLRIAMSYMAEFMGAYRLPNSVFGTADADTITDVIVLRKYGREALNKIAELTEQNPSLLVQAKVQWTEFINGDYFRGDGKRYVLGEFVPKDSTKFRDVDRVVSDQGVANVAKLLRKFPGSRVDWKLLEAAETELIEYADGDTMTLAGQTLQMQDGRWVSLGDSATDSSFDDLGQVLTSPVVAVANGVDWSQAADYVRYLRDRSMDVQMPDWLRAAYRDVQATDAADQPYLWSALVAGLATVEVTQAHGAEPGFNYSEEYPLLHDLIPKVSMSARKAPAVWSRNSKAALVKIGIVYDRKSGFSDLWMGKGQADVMDGKVIDEEGQVKAIKYRTQGVEIDVADLKAVYGENFDPISDDAWCLNADGTRATKADDYYVGNLADFLAKIDAQIATAPAGALRDKLLRQKDLARERVEVADPAELRFNLFSPFVTLEEKAEFLRQFAGPGFAVAVNNDGEPYIVYEGKDDTSEQKMFSRIASYITGDAGGRGVRSLTLQGKYIGMDEKDALAALRAMATKLNTQFDGYVKSRQMIMERLNQQANDPSRLYFTEVEDGSPVDIEGVSKEWQFHGYQNSFIRKQARSFGGINGFDVGGGKTATAAACIQYVQAIGVKKKTMVVVPNTVLSNWRKELVTGAGNPGEPGYRAPVFTSGDDCLFIGLDINPKTGKAVVDSGNYARDFTRVLENKHRKIFCTLEAFKAIPVKDETIKDYDAYLMQVDPSYATSDKKAESERADSKRAEATTGTGSKSNAIPFFEDMGVDSLVLDEAHAFKNSKQTVDFSGAKFLSVADASQRGLDIQIKAWYIRDLTPSGDGVLSLTATPITNSPLEIYSMLTLAAGEKKVHDLCMGIQGADDFMNTMCVIEEEEEESIDGNLKNYKVFRGLQNVSLLRTALQTIATIKSADDFRAEGQDIVLPDASERATGVALPQPVLDKLNEYKMAYRAARALMAEESPDPQEAAALARIQERFGESDELVGHPFNLINKMTLLIADPELDERATFYTFSKAQAATAEKAIAAFNALAKHEFRALPGPNTLPEDVVGTKSVRDGDDVAVLQKIRVQARVMADGRIMVDTMDKATQTEFEKQADKAGLELDCSVPPKLAALLENVRNEEAHPRSKSGRVKQLIFCDVLPMHNKIKRILVKRAGFSPSQIVFITGMDIKNPEQMQGIQDGFNADGEDNKYRAVIANEKAEVGINLQKGTQAIHHLTIGWTPDSQIQRNGRGVRQGNTTELVHVYHYDADGTFDEYKRKLTSKKNDWISSVMSKDGGNEVSVAGGLTNQQYEEMIESMGDAGALQSIRERAEMRERLARADSARTRQVINLQTAAAQTAFTTKFANATNWARDRAAALYDLQVARQAMEKRRSTTKNASSLVRLESRMAEMDARIKGELSELNEALEFDGGRTIENVLNPGSYYSTASKLRESVVRNAKWIIKGVKEDSTIHQEWASEHAAATAMVEAANKDFERIAAGGEGGYPAEVLAAMRDGKGAIIDGRVFCRGMFVRTPDGDLYVIHGAEYASRLGSRTLTVQTIASGKKFELIPMGTPAYEAALNEAAAFDDAAGEVTPSSATELFSSVVPAVAERRKNATLVSFDRDMYVLPAPLFPIAIDPAADGLSEAMRAIGVSQMSVIKSWTGRHFTADSTAGVTRREGGENERVRTFAQYLKGNGIKVTLADLSYVNYGDTERSNYLMHVIAGASTSEWPSTQDATAKFAMCNTVPELEDVAIRMLADAVPWIELQSGDFSNVAPVMIKMEYNTRNAQIVRQEAMVAAAKLAAEAAANGTIAPVAAATTQEPTAVAVNKLNAAVWVKPSNGEVRVYFNDIKAPKGTKAYVPKYAIDDGNDADWATIVTAGKYGGVLAPGVEVAVDADIDARIAQVFGGTKPTLNQLIEAAGGIPAAADTSGIEEVGGVAPNARGMIGITGKTRENMAIIKSCATEAGGRAIWNGRATRWEVPAMAWVKLQEKHPSAAKELQVVPC